MKPFEIIHFDGDEMCTVTFSADTAMLCGDDERHAAELRVCVRYSENLEADIEARYRDWLDLALETHRKEVATMTLDEVAMIAVEARDRAKSNTHRLDEMQSERSEVNRNISRMATAVEVLATEQRHQAEAQKTVTQKIDNIEKKVEGIELAPAKDAHDFKKEAMKVVLNVVLGAIFGAIIALIFK